MMSMKRYMPAIAIALVTVLLLMQYMPLALGQTNVQGVRVQLNGPSVVGALRGGVYTATISDPEGREWNYRAYVDGDNITGASPLEPEAVNGTLTSGNYTFSFNITANQRPGELDIHVNCTSGSLYYEKVQPIIVVSPITVSAEIKNPSNVKVNNVTVRFLVDGVEFDRQTLGSISAMGIETVSAEWIATDKEPGWHDSTILVDINGDGVIDIDDGDLMIEDRFYIEGGSDWMFAITVLVGLSALVIGFGIISRRKIR